MRSGVVVSSEFGRSSTVLRALGVLCGEDSVSSPFLISDPAVRNTD
jgi:hypothetical protein